MIYLDPTRTYFVMYVSVSALSMFLQLSQILTNQRRLHREDIIMSCLLPAVVLAIPITILLLLGIAIRVKLLLGEAARQRGDCLHQGDMNLLFA